MLLHLSSRMIKLLLLNRIENGSEEQARLTECVVEKEEDEVGRVFAGSE